MATVTGFTAARMKQIEDTTVVSGSVDGGGSLILARRDGVPINAGVVKGAKGDPGASFTVAAGVIEAFAGSVPPQGWMICDGSELLRAQYTELFGVIGTTYGSSGPLYFNLPDFRGRSIVGHQPTQAEFNNLGKIGGSLLHRHDFRFGLFDRNWAPTGSYAGMESAAQPNDNDRMGAFRYSTGKFQGATQGSPATTPSNLPNNSAIGGATGVTNNPINRMITTGDTDNGSSLPPYGVANFIISLGINASVPGGTPIVAQYQGRGTTAERNTIYGTPGTDAQRVALANQRVQWFNTELGWLEQYFATTGLSGLSVPGLITGVSSGWFPVGPGPEIVLEPSATFAASAGSYIGGWNGVVRRRGGAAWFNYSGSGIDFVVTGIYDFGWWTIQQTGTGEADYHTRLINASATVVDWMSNVAGGQLGTIYRRAEGHYKSQIVRATQQLKALTQSGTLSVHQVSSSQTYPPTRGEMYARYIRPPLVTD